MGVEDGVVWKYWNEFNKAIPEDYDLCTRVDQYRRATVVGDKTNVMLNYGYSLLESECLRAINTVDLDVHFGFLHADCATIFLKQDYRCTMRVESLSDVF